MHTIIIFREKEHPWLRELANGEHPLLFTLCNKPFIDFLVDFTILAGSRALRIATDGPTSRLERHCGNGSRWGIDISFTHLLPDDDRERILAKNRKFCTGGRQLILDGPLFIAYDKRVDYASWFKSCAEGIFCTGPSGSLTVTGNAENGCQSDIIPPASIPCIETVGDYFTLAKAILRSGERYILPGYSNEPDCAIGRNVVIQKGVEIRKPVMIGSNVQIFSGAIIGPDAIIGDNVIVDRESSVSGSILMSDTFIGEQLEIKGKIASGSLLVDPRSSQAITLQDPHLLSHIASIRSGRQLLRQLVHGVAAALLIMALSIPYAIFRILLGWQNNWTMTCREYPSAVPGRSIRMRRAEIRPEGMAAKLALLFAIDRFSLFFNVLGGSLSLIGHSPSRATAASTEGQAWQNLAVFSYAEAEAWPENETDTMIVDHYYAVHSNPFKDIGMTLKTFINRNHHCHGYQGNQA